MTSATETLPVETGGTDITRFNALRHGVLSLVHLDRKLERMLTMLLRLKHLRRSVVEG